MENYLSKSYCLSPPGYIVTPRLRKENGIDYEYTVATKWDKKGLEKFRESWGQKQKPGKWPRILIPKKYAYRFKEYAGPIILSLDYYEDELFWSKFSPKIGMPFVRFPYGNSEKGPLRFAKKRAIYPPKPGKRYEILQEMSEHTFFMIMREVYDIEFGYYETPFELLNEFSATYKTICNILEKLKRKEKLSREDIESLSKVCSEKGRERNAITEFLNSHYYDLVGNLARTEEIEIWELDQESQESLENLARTGEIEVYEPDQESLEETNGMLMLTGKIRKFKVCKTYQESWDKGYPLYKGCEVIFEKPEETKNGRKYSDKWWNEKKFCGRKCEKEYSKIYKVEETKT